MMRYTNRLLLGLVLLQISAPLATADLRDEVDRLVRNAPLKGATVAVSIRDCATGTPLVAIRQDEPMVPASNMKLLTSGVALHALGSNFEFKTRLLRDGDRLIVVGDGDPAFGDPELLAQMLHDNSLGLDVESFIGYWVKPIVDAGIKTVGEIVVDDRIFDREFVHPTWPADQLNNRYCAQVAGLNFHANVLHLFPRPTAGAMPEIGESQPLTPWLKIANSATCKEGPKDKNTAWIARKPSTNDLTLSGNVRHAYKSPVPVTIHDPPSLFAHMLRDRLTKAGITVGVWRIARKDDPVPSGAIVGPVVTTPMSTVLKRCNTDSENLYAECLLKRVGHHLTGEPGSWANGAAMARHVIQKRLGGPELAPGLIIADGSGLSAQNRITAGCMTAWLNSFHNDQQLGPAFIESLAVAGYSGTLENRMAWVRNSGCTVQAKTGYISNVSCLSGYVTTPDGRRRSFSVLVNGLKSGVVSSAKKLQDQIVAAIAEDLAAVPVQLGSD